MVLGEGTMVGGERVSQGSSKRSWHKSCKGDSSCSKFGSMGGGAVMR